MVKLNQDYFQAIQSIFHFDHVESPPPLETQHGMVGQLNTEIFNIF